MSRAATRAMLASRSPVQRERRVEDRVSAALLPAPSLARPRDRSPAGGSVRPKSNGEAAKTADQIVADAEAAATSASSVHVGGSGVSGGTPLSLNLQLVAGKGGKGHLAVNGLSFDIVRIGPTAYFKGDRRSGATSAAGPRRSCFRAGGSRRSSGNGRPRLLRPLTDIAKLFNAILGSHGTLSKGAMTTVNGQPAIAVVDTSKGGTLYVATTGKPYPLELEGPRKTGTITFDQVEQAGCALQAPRRTRSTSRSSK